jgi:hypothetical protein
VCTDQRITTDTSDSPLTAISFLSALRNTTAASTDDIAWSDFTHDSPAGTRFDFDSYTVLPASTQAAVTALLPSSMNGWELPPSQPIGSPLRLPGPDLSKSTTIMSTGADIIAIAAPRFEILEVDVLAAMLGAVLDRGPPDVWEQLTAAVKLGSPAKDHVGPLRDCLRSIKMSVTDGNGGMDVSLL